MPTLPQTPGVPVLRTDFSSDVTFKAVRAEVLAPTDEGFKAHVSFVEDRDFAGLGRERLCALVPTDFRHSILIIVDDLTIEDVEHPLVVVSPRKGCTGFRALPRTIQAIENNLSIGNLDFEDFSEAVDDKGVHRGF